MSLSRESKERFRKLLLDMRREVMDQVKAQHQSTRESDQLGDLGDNAARDLAAEYAYLFSDRLRKRLFLIDEASRRLIGATMACAKTARSPSMRNGSRSCPSPAGVSAVNRGGRKRQRYGVNP